MTHEMFGYDFMVDESYNVWFIEINSSPSMDYSTVKKKFFYIIEKINFFLL
jgi:D-alanine-D-alanine ligase-like ATP-grasp enzyme